MNQWLDRHYFNAAYLQKCPVWILLLLLRRYALRWCCWHQIYYMETHRPDSVQGLHMQILAPTTLHCAIQLSDLKQTYSPEKITKVLGLLNENTKKTHHRWVDGR